MCGIAGIISKVPMDIADTLINMLKPIQHRGPDAAGIAVFTKNKNVVLRATVQDESDIEKLNSIILKYAEIIDDKKTDAMGSIPFMEYELSIPEKNIAKLHEAINEEYALAVHSISKRFKVYKEGGHIDKLLAKHDIDNGFCKHGIGHVRMATESAEDINAAHPFVSPFYPELAVVHNGQFTNYFKLRRFLESKGVKFKTTNDSEAAAHLIAYEMKTNGGNLEEALKAAVDKMDGIFCLIAATPTQIGFAKDKLGIKPLLLLQTDDYVMFGSEQVEFQSLLDDVYAEEMEPGEVRVWNI